MSQFDGLADQAAEPNTQHGDKIAGASDQAVLQGGDPLDQAARGKYAGQVDQAQAPGDEKAGDNSP